MVGVRRYRETDLPQLVDLLNRACRDDHEFVPKSEGVFAEELGGADAILVAVGPSGQILGMCLLRRAWYGEELELHALSSSVRREVEERLMAEIEPQSHTGELTALVDAGDEERSRFFSARGYRRESHFYQMIAELSPSRTPSAPEGYLLRSLRPDEECAFVRMVNEAYSGERLDAGVLAGWKAEDPVFDEGCVHVAEKENRLVAAVVARSDWEYNAHYGAKRGYLGPAATLPAHRGVGLGRALTAQAMVVLGQRGMRTACLYTWQGNAAALRLTRHLGFRIGHEWAILRKVVPSASKR